jgi:hypothetical protein
MSKLRDELINDPLERGYANMTDAECAESLNTVNRTQYTAIGSDELLAWSGGGASDATSTKSRYERIEDAAANHASLEVKGACKAAVTLIDRDNTDLNLGLTDRAAMVDGLVAGGVLTSDEKDELVAMGTRLVSRAQELGIRKVLKGHVKKARV